ncbi:MAG: hypothetical protein EOO27_09255 [Comamonadaceae bacterium]|nr:MAG: hypothetical protein EOO27_09255 [Comamonadaceae bacterium]
MAIPFRRFPRGVRARVIGTPKTMAPRGAWAPTEDELLAFDHAAKAAKNNDTYGRVVAAADSSPRPAVPRWAVKAVFPVPLPAPARLVGTVDASRERPTPIPRTLEQAFGPAAQSGVLIAMDDDKPMHPADRLVTRVSVVCGALLLICLIAERLFS